MIVEYRCDDVVLVVDHGRSCFRSHSDDDKSCSWQGTHSHRWSRTLFRELIGGSDNDDDHHHDDVRANVVGVVVRYCSGH